MAKKKDKIIEAEVAIEETEMINEESATEEEVTETTDEQVSEVTTDAMIEDDSQFVYTQLKIINRLNNPAKARRLAERVLRNRKR